jgi:hypothetical protein
MDKMGFAFEDIFYLFFKEKFKIDEPYGNFCFKNGSNTSKRRSG